MPRQPRSAKRRPRLHRVLPWPPNSPPRPTGLASGFESPLAAYRGRDDPAMVGVHSVNVIARKLGRPARSVILRIYILKIDWEAEVLQRHRLVTVGWLCTACQVSHSTVVKWVAMGLRTRRKADHRRDHLVNLRDLRRFFLAKPRIALGISVVMFRRLGLRATEGGRVVLAREEAA